MPFSISQKYKNKFNRLRKTAPFLAMRSKRVKKHLTAFINSYEKLNQQLQYRALSGAIHVFLKHKCWSFYSFIHNLKKKLFAVFYLFDKNTCFSLIRSHGRGFFRPEASLFYFFIQKFFPRFFRKNPHVLAIENIDLVSQF